MRPKAFSYVRLSSDAQLKGDSRRRQLEQSRDYAMEHNLDLVEDLSLQDLGVSAYKGNHIRHGALGRILKAIEDGIIPEGSYILLESLDRLSRQDLHKAQATFLVIIGSGINIVTLADRMVYQAYEKDLGRLIISLTILARANEESEIKSHRLKAAWEQKRKMGSSKNLTSKCPAWLKPLKGVQGFDLIEARVAVVRMIFSQAIDGMGDSIITRKLNEGHVETFSGRSKVWSKSSVTKILGNRAVLGEYQPHKMIDGKRSAVGQVLRNYFPAIIDEWAFRKAAYARRIRRVSGRGRRGEGQSNLFTGLVRCNYCGSSIRFVDKGRRPKGNRYLICSGKINGTGCASSSWVYEKFETEFFAFVEKIDLTSEFDAAERRRKLAMVQASLQKAKEKREGLAAQYGAMYRDSLAETGAMRDLIMSELKKVAHEIEQQVKIIEELEQEERSLAAESQPSRSNQEELLRLIGRVREPDRTESRYAMAGKLKMLIDEILMAPVGDRNRTAVSRASRFKLEKGTTIGDPYFIVRFKDGSNRLVIPRSSHEGIEFTSARYDDKDLVIETDKWRVDSEVGIEIFASGGKKTKQ